MISIHALREERDRPSRRKRAHLQHFNPRAPRGARRLFDCRIRWERMISIHALREERDIGRTASIPEELISIHALREERDLPLATSLLEAVISIHALREERDTAVTHSDGHVSVISIHALREERDVQRLQRWPRNVDFNPRAPRGARQGARPAWFMALEFQSTRSARSATRPDILISERIHHFNPRAPRGARPRRVWLRACYAAFQSTRSARSATTSSQSPNLRAGEFQSTRSARSADRKSVV